MLNNIGLKAMTIIGCKLEQIVRISTSIGSAHKQDQHIIRIGAPAASVHQQDGIDHGIRELWL